MKFNQKNFDVQVYIKTNEQKQIVLDIAKKNLVSLENLESLVPNIQIQVIDASYNHLQEIEECVQTFTSLKHLNMSMNHIGYISNIEQLTNLNLSHNSIELVGTLNFPRLKILNLAGNQLKILPELVNIKNVLSIDVSKNQLEEINALATTSLTKLQKLNASHNKIKENYLKDLVIVLQQLPELLSLNLNGNEIQNSKSYKFEILKCVVLEDLDSQKISQHQIKKILELGKANQFDDAVEKTNQDYIDRMKKENQIKTNVKLMLNDQIKKVDDLFDKYQESTLTDQAKFVNYIKALEKRQRNGNIIEFDDDKLMKWKENILENDLQKRQKFENEKMKQQQLKDQYLNKQLTGGTLRQKLYEIAMTDPDLWREIKSKELDQVIQDQQMQEEEENEQMKRNQMEQDQQINQQYKDMDDYLKDDMTQKLQQKMQIIDNNEEQNMNYNNNKNSSQKKKTQFQ